MTRVYELGDQLKAEPVGTLYAWLAFNEADQEGVLAANVPSGVPLPFITSRREVAVGVMRQHVREIVGASITSARLVTYKRSEVLDIITPADVVEEQY